MRRFVCLFAGGCLLFLAGACRSQQQEATYRPTATIKDIMDSMVDPSADVDLHLRKVPFRQQIPFQSVNNPPAHRAWNDSQ